MLGKLLKYDIKSTWRDFAAIYMAILLGVIIAPIGLKSFNNQVLNVLLGFIIFGIVVAVIAVTIINLFKIFNTNVFSKEGYLTLTLPVTSRQIVTSKILVSSLWITLTGIVSILGLIIFVLITSSNEFLINLKFIINSVNMMGFNGYLSIFLLTIGAIISITKEVAKLFLSCSIAHIKQFNKFRVPAGILSYFAFSWIEAALVQAIVSGISFISKDFELIMAKLDHVTNPFAINEFLNYFNWLIGSGIIYAFLFTIAFSYSTIWILNNKLDLD